MNGRRRQGFTLIEVLVAVVIFLIFISAVYATFHAANRSMTQAQAQEDVYQTGRVLLAQLNSELASAYQPSASRTSALIGTDTDGASTDLQSDQLNLLTTAHQMGAEQKTGGLCRVSYMMGGDTEDEQPGLYMEVNPHPGREIADEQFTRQLLSPLVVGFNCKYLPVGGEWEVAWPEEQTTLPVAVRVELTLQSKEPGSKPVILVTTANLRMATAPEGATSGE